MPNAGQTSVTDLADTLSKRESVSARLALVTAGEEWRIHHGELVLDDGVVKERVWRYATAAFLELSLPGPTAAALLRGEAQEVAGLPVAAAGQSTDSASTQRLRGHESWNRVATPWPRTEWTITRDSSTPPGNDVLVGEGPSFFNFDQALSAFLYELPHDNNANRSDLWRIVLPQRAGWFPRITIAPDLLTVSVEGDALDGTILELSTPAGNRVHSVDGADDYTFELPGGLPHDSFLVLRGGDQWLDFRSFPAPLYGRARDASVVWEQPGPELDILLAAGEGQYLECKQEIPEGESRRKMLKTIAAFASQDGGIVLIGVRDDLEIIGLPEGRNVDKQLLQVAGMIRDNLEPEPPYTHRIVDHEGKKVLAIEVSAGGQMHALRNGPRAEFYVRRGPNTVPARQYEVAAGFRVPQVPSTGW